MSDEAVALLRSLEWSGGYSDEGGTNSCCPSCGADAPMTVHFPARRIDAYTREEAHDKVIGGEHDPTCALAAILSKHPHAC